jgi:hypothetical protein
MTTSTELTVPVTDAMWAAAAGDPAALTIAVYDGTVWVPIATYFDSVDQVLTATTEIDAALVAVMITAR